MIESSHTKKNVAPNKRINEITNPLKKSKIYLICFLYFEFIQKFNKINKIIHMRKQKIIIIIGSYQVNPSENFVKTLSNAVLSVFNFKIALMSEINTRHEVNKKSIKNICLNFKSEKGFGCLFSDLFIILSEII